MNVCPECSRHIEGFPCPDCGYAPAHIDGFVSYAPALARDAPGFDPRHYRALAEMEAGSFWFRSRNALILWAISRYLRRSGTYLEIGCGTGYVTSAVAKAFPDLQTSGSEIFVEGLSIAAARAPSTSFFQMDARHIPYASAFDVIGAFDVLEHIDEDVDVLRQIHGALKPGGGLILTVPQHPWLWSRQDEIAHHARRYARGELERKLRGCSLTPRYSTSFVSLLLPVLAASRRQSRSASANADPSHEFRIPRWLDGMLSNIMTIERGLIKAGLRFPAGGSRLIVATKDET